MVVACRDSAAGPRRPRSGMVAGWWSGDPRPLPASWGGDGDFGVRGPVKQRVFAFTLIGRVAKTATWPI